MIGSMAGMIKPTFVYSAFRRHSSNFPAVPEQRGGNKVDNRAHTSEWYHFGGRRDLVT
jgi:hypothetical protein